MTSIVFLANSRSADDSSHPRTGELINASREMELQCRYCAQLIREVLREESEELIAIRGRSRAGKTGSQ